jgi:nucleoside phosphorylase
MKSLGLAVALALSVEVLSACVQMPTEKQQSVDLRPQISFAINSGSPAHDQMEVFLDGLPVGPVSNYLVGQQALRVLSGSHVIRIMAAGSLIKEERIYVGDGMTKVITVN